MGISKRSAPPSKADDSAGCACEVNAGEREGEQEIKDEESDDTVTRAYRHSHGGG